MEDLTSVNGSELLSGIRFRIGIKGSAHSVDVDEHGLIRISNLKFRQGDLFTFDNVGGKLLVRVERKSGVSEYKFLGYLREEDGSLIVNDEPIANIRLERHESVYYRIVSKDKYYNITDKKFIEDSETIKYSMFYFVKE